MVPAASRIASETKFSLAISSRREFWRSVSWRIKSKISGSASAKGRAGGAWFSDWVILISLQFCDLLYPAFVAPAALKLGFDKQLYKFIGGRGVRVVGAESEDVGVVMAARELHFVRVHAQRRAHAVNFICRDGHADAGATDEDAAIG